VKHVAVMYLLVIAMWLIPSSLWSQETEKCILVGRVQDREGRPISDAMVSLPSSPVGFTVTNENGSFTLEVPGPLPSWDLLVIHPHYPCNDYPSSRS